VHLSIWRLCRERQTVESELKFLCGDVGVQFQSICDGFLSEPDQPLAELVVPIQHCNFRCTGPCARKQALLCREIILERLVKIHVLAREVGKHSGLKMRSEEHTSELQSRFDLVCRLLLEKKKKTKK